MPASHHAAISDSHLMRSPSCSSARPHSHEAGSESAFSILQSVKQQEAQLEKLTRELEAERQDVSNRLVRCTLQSEDKSGMPRGLASQPHHLDETYSWNLQDDDFNYSSRHSHLVDSCQLINRKVETTINQKIERKETMARRVLPADKGPNMPQYFPYSTQYYSGEPHVQNQESNYSVNVTYRPTSSPAPTTGPGLVGPNSNPANGYAVNPDNPSPNSSQLSVHSSDVGHPQLISRTTTRNSTQQVTTVTKVIKSRELRHIGPDGQPLEYDPTVTYGSTQAPPPPPPSDFTTYGYSGMTDPASRSDYGTYDSGRPPSPGGQEPPPGQDYLHYVGRPHSPSSEASSRRNYDSYPSPHRSSYQDYDPHLHPPPPPAGQARSPPPVDYAVYHLHQDGPPPGGYQGGYGSGVSGSTGGNGLVGSGGNYSDLADRPPTPPSPTSDASASPLPQRAMPQAPGPLGQPPYPLSGYEELDNTLVLARPPRNSDLYDPYGSHTPHHGGPYGTPAYYDHHKPSTNVNTYADHPSSALYEDEEFPSDDQQPQSDVRWRDPDLSEVVEFLQHPNNVVKANAAAYLQHLCFNEDDVKQKVRSLGGIPPLISMLSHEIPEVHRNACGALRNLSYGRQNDENKRAIKNAGGVPALIRLLRKTPDNEVRELVTGILWNLSSCEELKKPIIDDGLTVITNVVIIPHSGWDRNMDASEGLKNAEIYWSTVFRNASGVLRNVSSAGEYARRKLRECEGLVDALLHLVKAAIGKNDIDNKSVENCVCVLRNLSYRCQEVDDPNYDRHEQVAPQMKAGFPAGDNLGCFGGSKKKKEAQNVEKQRKETTGTSASPRPRSEPVKGMELLWQPEVVHVYLALLSDCSNPETLEAAAGAIQNLAACYWQASIDIRAAVRKEKGLPVLVELLRMEVDRVVCAVATALRNLALDQRNKELIGKYAMKDLVQKLPSESQHHETGTSDDTYTAVLATLNEVIKKNAEFARSLLETGGIDRLMYITRQRTGRFSIKVTKFASQVLFNLWQHQELREAYKKQGWKENNFVTRTMAARSLSPSNANSTLNRPISTQGGTKYEDKTLQRSREVNSASAAAVRTPENPIYNRPSEEVPLTEMPFTGEPTHRPPVGGVQVFPPGLVNREKKKLRQYDDGQSYQGGTNEAWDYERQQQQQHLLMDGQEEGQQGGDSWV